MNYVPEYHGDKTLFSKRVYVWNNFYFNEKVYKDELVSFKIFHYFEVVENPKINWLESDLGFSGFSELVFDREQELRSMLQK